MAYTFGAGTGDDINLTTAATMLGNSRFTFVCGWWLPTTLTSTRGLWSAGNTARIIVDTTTSQLRLVTDNTTDGIWTAPAGMATNVWSFIAVLGSFTNTGPAAAWRVWVGNWPNAPSEITVTQSTAPVGNFTASSAFTIGNVGTGTVAWQGDIDEIYWYNAATQARGLVEAAALGAITQAEADFVFQRWVLPLWLGAGWGGCPTGLPTFWQQDANAHQFGYIPLGIQRVGYTYDTNTAVQAYTALTVNGATLSQNRCPRPAPLGMPMRAMARL